MSGAILIVCDHASNHVPPGIKLGVDPALLDTHIAWDIGAAAVAGELGYPAHVATVSRLVVDCNRDEHDPGVIPITSDGHAIPGNYLTPAERADRMLRFYHSYHDTLAARIDKERPALLLSLHSFTPQLSSESEPRPWQIGVLYNQDDRAARIAIPLLRAAGIVTGDQQPYSGKLLNHTMNRHGEGTGTPYLGIEMRQDLIGSADGARHWATVLRPVIERVLAEIR